MVNYKPSSNNLLETAGVTIKIDSSYKIKFLYDPTDSVTVVDSFLDVASDAVYQVPTGRTFHCMGIRVDTGNGLPLIPIFEGATEDAETTQLIKLAIAASSNLLHEFWINDVTFAAGKYIVLKPSAAYVKNIYMIGYETVD